MNTMKIGLALCLSLILIGSSTGLTCIQCSSSNTAECTTTPGQVNSTCESKLCFHTQDKETKEVIRGCFSDQSTSVCKLPECKVCDASDRCNNDPYNIGKVSLIVQHKRFAITSSFQSAFFVTHLTMKIAKQKFI